jgi:hypothetical protein
VGRRGEGVRAGLKGLGWVPVFLSLLFFQTTQTYLNSNSYALKQNKTYAPA